MADKIDDILSSWNAGRNVLLYGPPATGKTRLISELFDALNRPPEAQSGILLDVNDAEEPFSRPTKEVKLPQPIKVVWTTFHQSYGYEDFVIGLRPETTNGGMRLQPLAGVLLDAAIELSNKESKYKSVVIFIDEINRGNAARIFGEFMTFLDFDYREGGRVPLPLPLRQLTFKNGQSEMIQRLDGSEATIPERFFFPKDIYIVATMNSVDRSAVPIDSALARRFDRIEMRPNLDILAKQWSLDKTEITSLPDDNWEALSPFETCYLLLDRLNLTIASDLGPEFELGHGLLSMVKVSGLSSDVTSKLIDEKEAWLSLAKTWDEILFPQLEDRYSGRPEQLMDLLRVDNAPPSMEYAWKLRSSKTGTFDARSLASVRVCELDIEIIKKSFRWLTR